MAEVSNVMAYSVNDAKYVFIKNEEESKYRNNHVSRAHRKILSKHLLAVLSHYNHRTIRSQRSEMALVAAAASYASAGSRGGGEVLMCRPVEIDKTVGKRVSIDTTVCPKSSAASP